jgi:hypothetical protein
VTIGAKLIQRISASADAPEPLAADGLLTHTRDTWRMPPLDQLPPAQLTPSERVWLIVLRAYLLVAAGLVLARIVMLAIGNA